MPERYIESIRCSYCDQLNDPNASNCRWCGKALKPSFGDKPPLVGGEHTKGILPWICQICGSEFTPELGSGARCSVCGRIVCAGCVSKTFGLFRRGPITCVECKTKRGGV